MTEINRNVRVDREELVSVQKQAGYQQQRQIVKNVDASRRTFITRITQLIWLLFGILEALIGLRVFLKLIAANPASPMAKVVYGFTEFFLWPFQGLTIEPSAQGMVLEIPAIIAIFVYIFIGWAIVRMIWLLFYHPASRMMRTVEREDFDQPIK